MTTLSDADIMGEIKEGRLVITKHVAGTAGACYELRMGNVYYDLTENGKRFALRPDETVLIKPGHRVVLITQEELDVPADMLVRIVNKGSLFSIGLSPIATYADPGFKGNVGIVTQNISDKYIELPQGEPIAKADFTRLTSKSNRPYCGQHGFQLGIWPIKTHLQKDHNEVKHDTRVGPEREEALALLPNATRTIVRRLERTQLIITVGILLAVLINAFALFAIGGAVESHFYAIVANLVCTVIISVITFIINYTMRNTR